jgi:putative spermidine/putrescine transport system permease protein/spermidine/putrescine transport system permease protein
MVSSRIANDIEIFFNWGAASALGVVLLLLTALLIFGAMRLTRVGSVLSDRAAS